MAETIETTKQLTAETVKTTKQLTAETVETTKQLSDGQLKAGAYGGII